MAMHRRWLRAVAVGGLFGAALLRASDACAEPPAFSRFDIPTVFYISKSDDHNRVDYGIHLDSQCVPIQDDAVFQYWRVFEKAPPVRLLALSALDRIAYGISEQRTVSKTTSGAVHFLRLRQFQKTPIDIVTTRGRDGRCSSQARTAINGKECELTSVYVNLGKGFLIPSVEFIDVFGKDPQTGQNVSERIRR
jgi:Domain of unknown function (DUF4833)